MATLTLNPTATNFAEKHRIDERAGIIYGMSVITIGDARGHGLKIDAKTLETTLAATKSHKDGVLCKGDHGSGIFEALGTVKNCHIDGDKLRGDLHLFKSHPRFESVIEVARRMPASMGLSISFSYQEEESFVRVTSLYSIDLVSNPAANPDGMFSSRTNTRDTTKLAACYLAAFGQEQYSAVVNKHGPAAFDYMERGLYYSGLNVSGYDFSNASRHGEAKPPFGLRRIETAERQARIDACLSRLK